MSSPPPQDVPDYATCQHHSHAEDKSAPLNDDKLVAELKKHGIDIARRTVAKYRNLLGIPSSRKRKEY